MMAGQLVKLTFFASLLVPAFAATSTCVTSVGSVKLRDKCRTTTTTCTTPCTKTITTTTTRTSALPVITVTNTTTVITVATAPTTFSVATTTEIDTETDTTTVTLLATETATSILGLILTTTVAVPSGFQGVPDTLDGSTYDGALGSPPPEKRAAPIIGRAVNKQTSPKKLNLVAQFPQIVICTTTKPAAKCTTKTKTATKISTLPALTFTKTATTTSTSTFYPSATTTFTVTSTSTTLATTQTSGTTTLVSTSTTYTATYTAYDACATNYFADSFNNPSGGVSGGTGGTLNLPVTGAYSLNSVSAQSAYECCQASFGSTLGVSLFWFLSPAGTCYFGTGDTCPAQQTNTLEVQLADGGGDVYGNGACGAWVGVIQARAPVS